MRRHVMHTLAVALSVAAAAVPALLADPAVRAVVVHHPAVAAYLPVVSGIVYAIAHAITKSRKGAGA